MYKKINVKSYFMLTIYTYSLIKSVINDVITGL